MSQEPEVLRKCLHPSVFHMSHVMCHIYHVSGGVSGVTCHMSHFTCHVSHITCQWWSQWCHMSQVLFFFLFLQSFGASRWSVCMVSTGLTLSSFICVYFIKSNLLYFYIFISYSMLISSLI